MSEGSTCEPPEIATDRILDGRLVLRQLCRGHRAGTDAVLLAAAVRVEPGDRLIDVGAGVGTVGLALALRAADMTGALLESDPLVAGLAAENCRLNGTEERLTVAICDLFSPGSRRAAGIEDGKATLVVTNAPFYAGCETRPSPEPRKASAHQLDPRGRSHGHAAWFRAALALLAPKGRFYAIHRPAALMDILASCEGRLGGIGIMPVHARADEPAIRFLLSGIKASRAPMRLCPPLVLHGPDGRFTPFAEALHRGEALVDMERGPIARASQVTQYT